MAPSFDFALSSLLCAEETVSVFDEPDDGFECTRQSRIEDINFIGDFPLHSDDSLAMIFKNEFIHVASDDYVNRLRSGFTDLSARRIEVVDWIVKVSEHFNFEPLCVCLSVNYLDRFLSAYQLPEGKNWMLQLSAVACLSLAAKVEEIKAPDCIELQIQVSGLENMFECKTVRRMELLILNTLKWRMRAITPFSFLDYFLHKLDNYKRLPSTAITHSISLILTTIKGIDFLGYRPSEIAAAVAVFVSGEATDEVISIFTQHVQKVKMVECVEMMNVYVKESSVGCVPFSPIGVLDAATLSYTS